MVQGQQCISNLNQGNVHLTPSATLARKQGSRCRRFHQLARSSAEQAGTTVRRVPDGDLGLPLVGETLSALLNGNNFGIERVTKYGKIWKTNILGNVTVMVYDEADVKQVLASEGKFTELTWPSVTEQLVGKSSLNLLQGEQHAQVKKLLSVAFDSDALRAYTPVLQNTIKEWCDSWAAKGSIRALDEAKLLAFATLSQTFLGFPVDRQSVQRNVDLMEKVTVGFQTIPVNFPGSPYTLALTARQDLVQQLDDVLVQWSAAGTTESDFVPGLVRAARAVDRDGTRLSSQETEDNMMAALFGNNSAGPTMAKALQYIGGDVLHQLREEQQGVVLQYGDALSLPALDQMPFLDAVVQELLRITPAVPAVFRKAVVDFNLGGYLIPKGWNVWCHLGDAVLQYNRDDFRPQRWLRDTQVGSQGACPFMMPFGSGTRTCLGRPLVMLQTKILVALLARHYSWQCVNPNEEWQLVPVPQPKQGLEATFTRLP